MTTRPDARELHLDDLDASSLAACDAGELFSCTVDGEQHLVWEALGEAYLVPAWCPHRPAAGPTLARHALIGASSLLCLRHHNVYDLASGRCVHAPGPGDPGVLQVRRGRRAGTTFVVHTADAELRS